MVDGDITAPRNNRKILMKENKKKNNNKEEEEEERNDCRIECVCIYSKREREREIYTKQQTSKSIHKS